MLGDDISGYDIIKKLRLNSATKRLPVIMVTAKSTELDMIKGLEDGAVHGVLGYEVGDRDRLGLALPIQARVGLLIQLK